MRSAIKNWQSDLKLGPNQPSEKTKYASAFRILFRYIKPHWLAFTGVFLCTIIAISAEVLQPYLVKIAIDDNLMIEKNDYKDLLVIGGKYLLLSLLSLLFTYIQNNLLQYTGQSIVAKIRKQLFEHIQKLSMSYFDKVPSGSLLTHISSDTEALNQFFNQVLLSMMRDGMTLLFIILLMFQLDTTLALYCLILLPIIAFIAIAFRSYMRKTYQMSRSRLSRMVAFVAENLSGMNLIQVFHQEKEQGKLFTARNQSYFQANVREIRTNVLFNRTFEILSNLSVAFVTWVGGMAVLGFGNPGASMLKFGVLYAFITYVRQFFQPINNITQQWNTLQSATVAVNRIWNIFAIQPEVEDMQSPRAVALSDIQGQIDFNRVSFAYTPDIPIIRNLDLHIPAGDMIGIVGTTGAGKSSLISLLCRFYDVQVGSIKIDGTDIRELPQSSLHRIVGLVQQEPYLYSGSILDNVRLFDESISRDDVIRACKFVGADPLIQSMKDGYDTRLSERGSGLSAGERQLISFARIIVFEPKILILDEATANLDSHTEQLIQSALQLVSVGRTTIVIAHRLSTIMQADRILVMQKGEIIESGTHRELIEQHGYYEQMYRHSQGDAMIEAG